MGRFDRDESPAGSTPALGTATDDLRATVEEKLREIVEAAEARAHEIEDRALEQALEIEQDAERKAKGRFADASQRAEQLRGAIDAFEGEVAEAVRSLRARGEALARELGATLSPVAPEVPSPEPPTPEEPAAEEPAPEQPPSDEREEVRKRILDLFMAGKPRVDAERMLTQLDDGGRYIDLLEEVYESHSETQQGSNRRRGGRRRRRPGTP